MSNTLVLATAHRFNEEQLRLLNRGPSYVPPCQTGISSSHAFIDEEMKEQYAPLQHRLASFFDKYRVNIALSKEVEKQISEQFKDLFCTPIPQVLYDRAVSEMGVVQSIRSSLKQRHLILRRTADHMNTFYVGDTSDFEAKADDYPARSDAYEVLLIDDEENGEQRFHDQFDEMIQSINMALGILKSRKALDGESVDRLRVDRDKVELPYLYFLPDVDHVSDMFRIHP